MAQRYVFPQGPLVDGNGTPTLAGKAYLKAIQDWNGAIMDIENIDNTALTSQVRDKLIELIEVLKG